MRTSYQTFLFALLLSTTHKQVLSSAIPESKSPQLPCTDTSLPTTHSYQPQSRPWIAPRAVIIPLRDPIPDPIVPDDPEPFDPDPFHEEPIFIPPDDTPKQPDGVRPTGDPDPTASAPKPTATGEKEAPDLPDLGGSSSTLTSTSTSFVIWPSPTAVSKDQIGRGGNVTESSGQGGLDPGQVYSAASSWELRRGSMYWVLVGSLIVGSLCI